MSSSSPSQPADVRRQLAEYFAKQRQWPSRPSTDPEGVEVVHEWHPPLVSVAHVVNRDRALVYDTFCPEAARAERRDAVAHFCARVNFELGVGVLSIDWASGRVRCRTAVSLLHAELTESLIAAVVYPHHQVLVDFIEHLVAVVRGDMEPDEAFDEAMEQVR